MAAALSFSGAGFNPFGRAWKAYERALRRNPVLTQAASSAALWGLGDGMAQRIERCGRGGGGIDARRVALTAGFGGAVVGPAGHGWYLLLEKLVLRLGLGGGTRALLLKVALDNVLYSPAYVLAFFAFGCLAIDGLGPAAFADQLRQQFLPTMLAEALVWPPYMALVFSRVPLQHQLLAVNVATLFDVCFLSWMRCQHDTDGAKQHAAAAAVVVAAAQLKHHKEKHTRQPKQEKVVAAAATASASVGRTVGQEKQQEQKQQKQGPPRTAGEARRRELEEAMWDVEGPEPCSLSRTALMMAASTTSYSYGSAAGSRTASRCD